MDKNAANPLLDYAPAPKGMSRAKLAAIIGTAGATLAIGGVVYQLTRPAPDYVMPGSTILPWDLRPQDGGNQPSAGHS